MLTKLTELLLVNKNTYTLTNKGINYNQGFNQYTYN